MRERERSARGTKVKRVRDVEEEKKKKQTFRIHRRTDQHQKVLYNTPRLLLLLLLHSIITTTPNPTIQLISTSKNMKYIQTYEH